MQSLVNASTAIESESTLVSTGPHHDSQSIATRESEKLLVEGWDELLCCTKSDFVFLTSAWLRSWHQTLGQSRDLILPTVHRDNRLVAAAAFYDDGGVVRFAADDRADYGDVLLHESLNENEKVDAVEELLGKAKAQTGTFKHFMLNRVRDSSPLMRALSRSGRWHASLPYSTVAPAMSMQVVDEKLKKKSLRRHENGLKRRGTLTFEVYTRPDDIAVRLDDFFAQHIDRWAASTSPSLFNHVGNQEFYRALVSDLGSTGSIRFAELRLDGVLVASHFGFFHAGTFTWYKPTYDPALAKHSPGEVLIKRLLEAAQNEGADLFDFTIGNEAFKSRFATEVEAVHNLYVTDSKFYSYLRDARIAVKSMLEQASSAFLRIKSQGSSIRDKR